MSGLAYTILVAGKGDWSFWDRMYACVSKAKLEGAGGGGSSEAENFLKNEK